MAMAYWILKGNVFLNINYCNICLYLGKKNNPETLHQLLSWEDSQPTFNSAVRVLTSDALALPQSLDGNIQGTLNSWYVTLNTIRVYTYKNSFLTRSLGISVLN